MLKNVVVYLLVALIFLGALGSFMWFSLRMLPKQFAIMVIGLAGFTVMTVGPFWAMALERIIRETFEKRRK